jgi:lipopolysaccharide export LptBFGC system permease protein LptF
MLWEVGRWVVIAVLLGLFLSVAGAARSGPPAPHAAARVRGVRRAA